MTNYECAGGPGPNYGETAVFAFCRKAEKRPKIRFSLYKHPPNGSSLLIIWEKATFFFWQLFPVVAGTWLGLRSESFFFAQNFRFSARKSVFWYGTAIFVNGPFVALAVPVVLAPSEAFFDFSFPSYGVFQPPGQNLTIDKWFFDRKSFFLKLSLKLIEVLWKAMVRVKLFHFVGFFVHFYKLIRLPPGPLCPPP